jgi:uncharacterized protein (DUF305 family)
MSMTVPKQVARVGALGLAAVLTALGAPAPGAAQHAPHGGAPAHTAADTRFMQGMLVHHAQAVEMTELVPTRAARADVRRLAARIAVGQEDEMAWMRRWLEARDEEVPSLTAAEGHGHHGHHHHGPEHALMPGMLDAEGMARLRAARGEEFDRLFLEAMIAHHEGALVMVEELLATDGAAHESETYRFVAHVESDQRIEIDRMRRMLAAGEDR